MRRTELFQEIRKMRFEEAYGGWQSRRLAQFEAVRLLSSVRVDMEQEGAASSFRGVREVMEKRGLFASLCATSNDVAHNEFVKIFRNFKITSTCPATAGILLA